MARLIPKKMKSKGEVYRRVIWADLAVCVIAFLTVVFVVISTLPLKLIIVLAVLALSVTLVVRVDTMPIYTYVIHFLRHFVLPHRFARDVSDMLLVDREESKQRAFGELFNDEEALRRQELNRLLADPNVPDDVKEKIRLHRAQEEKRERKAAPEDRMKCRPVEQICAFTEITEDLIGYANEYYAAVFELPAEQAPVDQARIAAVSALLRDGRDVNIVKLDCPIRTEGQMMLAPHYYIVFFDENKARLNEYTLRVAEYLPDAKRLNSREIAVFLKYSNYMEFDQTQIDCIAQKDYALWAMPQLVKIRTNSVEVNRVVTHNFCVAAYPAFVEDGWLAELLSIPATKCVIKCRPMENDCAISLVQTALQDRKNRQMDELLSALEQGEELLQQVSVYFTAYDLAATEESAGRASGLPQMLPRIPNFRKMILERFRESGMILHRMPFDQFYAFVGAQVSRFDANDAYQMPSASICASYPWLCIEKPQEEVTVEEACDAGALGTISVLGLDELIAENDDSPDPSEEPSEAQEAAQEPMRDITDGEFEQDHDKHDAVTAEE